MISKHYCLCIYVDCAYACFVCINYDLQVATQMYNFVCLVSLSNGHIEKSPTFYKTSTGCEHLGTVTAQEI